VIDHGLVTPTDEQIRDAVEHYREHGWARLGRWLPEHRIAELRQRADAIMLGEVTYPGLFFQHDSDTGSYDDLEYGKGWKGPSLKYRKVEKLELDPIYWAWITDSVFRRVTELVYPNTDVALYRAFLMNKHAGGGSNLPWHQDGGQFWGLDRDPTLQIWTALDDAPVGGGCVEVAPGTHLAGLATSLGGVVPADKLEPGRAEERALPLPAMAGEVLLLHNHVWHRSGRTTMGKARRALSVCYMDARTQCRRRKRAPRTFVRVFAASGSPC
jgi:phytanoyl-CoA hydroxylase